MTIKYQRYFLRQKPVKRINNKKMYLPKISYGNYLGIGFTTTLFVVFIMGFIAILMAMACALGIIIAEGGNLAPVLKIIDKVFTCSWTDDIAGCIFLVVVLLPFVYTGNYMCRDRVKIKRFGRKGD